MKILPYRPGFQYRIPKEDGVAYEMYQHLVCQQTGLEYGVVIAIEDSYIDWIALEIKGKQ